MQTAVPRCSARGKEQKGKSAARRGLQPASWAVKGHGGTTQGPKLMKDALMWLFFHSPFGLEMWPEFTKGMEGSWGGGMVI